MGHFSISDLNMISSENIIILNSLNLLKFSKIDFIALLPDFFSIAHMPKFTWDIFFSGEFFIFFKMNFLLCFIQFIKKIK